MSTDFKNGITQYGGVPVGGSQFTGNNYYVDSGNSDGSDNPSSGTKAKPFSTLDYAVSQCAASNGDVIYVLAGHTETLAADSAVDLDVAGITVIGLGSGSDVPVMDYTDAAGTFVIGADNVSVYNLNFHANVPEVVVGVVVEAGIDYACIKGCRFDVETTGTDEFLISIQTNDASNEFCIKGNRIDNGLGASVHAIKLVADSDNSVIKDNFIIGDYSTANIGGITTLSTNLLIENNILINGESGAINTEPVIEMLTGTTGIVRRNTFFCNLATIAAQTVADAMIFSENFAGEDVGAAAGNILRTDAVSVAASADD